MPTVMVVLACAMASHMVSATHRLLSDPSTSGLNVPYQVANTAAFAAGYSLITPLVVVELN